MNNELIDLRGIKRRELPFSVKLWAAVTTEYGETSVPIARAGGWPDVPDDEELAALLGDATGDPTDTPLDHFLARDVAFVADILGADDSYRGDRNVRRSAAVALLAIGASGFRAADWIDGGLSVLRRALLRELTEEEVSRIIIRSAARPPAQAPACAELQVRGGVIPL